MEGVATAAYLLGISPMEIASSDRFKMAFYMACAKVVEDIKRRENEAARSKGRI